MCFEPQGCISYLLCSLSPPSSPIPFMPHPSRWPICSHSALQHWLSELGPSEGLSCRCRTGTLMLQSCLFSQDTEHKGREAATLSRSRCNVSDGVPPLLLGSFTTHSCWLHSAEGTLPELRKHPRPHSTTVLSASGSSHPRKNFH